MMATLEAQGRLDNTLVVVWSDHGEQFWEHGGFQHNQSLHAEENDAIFFLSGLDVVAQAWTEPTSTVDILPTVLQHLGQPIPGGLAGCPVKKAEVGRPQFSARQHSDAVTQAVTVGNQKLIHGWSGSFLRYDIEVDPEESVNLYEEGGAEEAVLWRHLESEVAALGRVLPEETPKGMP